MYMPVHSASRSETTSSAPGRHCRRVLDSGVDIVTVGQQASFVIDTSEVGAGNLSVTVDGPSNVIFLKYYLKFTLFIVLKVY
jgi:hypothetical protein